MADEIEPKARWWSNRRNLLVLAVTVVAVAGIGAAFAYTELKRPEDVSNEDVPFIPPKKQPKKKPKGKKAVPWPTFRYDRARTGYLPVEGIKPPFKRLWKYGDQPLLEFPPVVAKGRLYFVDNDGHAIALDADTGKEVWRRKIASLNASSPTYSRGRLYVVNLEPGQALALDARTGRTIWRRPLPGRSESSPVVVRNRVYFGCENGELFALRADNGKEVWSTALAGEIKAAPAYENGTLYVGDYGGAMSAVRARNGEIRWQTQALGPGLGQAGSFYSTPAVAYGRVYAGNNDARVYSFDAETGELAWTYSTGDWVYSGPTVAKTPGTPPTVYIGSFDGNVYALTAKDGEARWVKPIGGKVIGSLSVIGRTVYVATFEGTTTYGLRATNGSEVYEFHTGAYMPGISDGKRLYLVGYSSIHALRPITPQQKRAMERAAAVRKEARQKARRQRARQDAKRSSGGSAPPKREQATGKREQGRP